MSSERGITMSLIRNQPEPITKLGFAEVDYVNASAILNRATGFIDSYDYTLNPYKGLYLCLSVLLCC